MPVYLSRDEVRQTIEALARDGVRYSRCLSVAARLWKRDDPTDVVQETFQRLIDTSEDTTRADAPFIAVVCRKIRHVSARAQPSCAFRRLFAESEVDEIEKWDVYR